MKKQLYSCSLLALISAAGFVMASAAHANPQDGVVVGGAASISGGAGHLDVHQSTDKAVIDWRSFNIGQGETTQFHQPSSSSLTINRIKDGNPTQILGNLSANGNLVVINPSGVMFSKDAKVDVNGLVATTSDISNADAMAGNLNFYSTGAGASEIVNNGTITAKDAGLVGLVAPHVTNNGTITAKLGKVHLASGDQFSVDFYGDGLINVALGNDVTSQLVANTGKINAEGGTINMAAATGANVVSSLVNIEGELRAPSITNSQGKITISGDVISHTGIIDVSGTDGGSVSVSGRNVMNQGKINADGAATGGTIDVAFTERYLDNESSRTTAKGGADNGGRISVKGTKDGSRAFASGTYDASSTGNKGGHIELTAKKGDLKLYGAKLHADGKTGGGKILVGGDYQGTGTLDHASTTTVNFGTKITANATDTGNGGQVVIWSDDETKFAGHAYALGGAISGNGGMIELSSKETLTVSGFATTDASATNGVAGSLLLDPKNIIVATGGISGGGISSFDFVDPNPDAGTFASNIMVLSNGNVIIIDSEDDLVASNAGAVYMFNGSTGALISTLTGSSADDSIGSDSFSNVELRAGNAVILSTLWDNGGITDAGAITFFNTTTGLSGIINDTNSLVGTQTDDFQSSYVAALTNGNYVIQARNWDNGGVVDAGAAIWGNGTTGVSGVVSSANALVGTEADSFVGEDIVELKNGNYIVLSSSWNNSGVADVGAVTWGNGATGVFGAVDTTNSIYGTTAGDRVGLSYNVLPNGNYVIGSYEWDNGLVSDASFVMIADGSAATAGAVSSANAMVGESSGDYLRVYVDYYLGYNNILVYAPWWDDGGVVDVGAVGLFGTTAGSLTGTISSSNFIIGTQTDDRVGYGQLILSNGNFVVTSHYWNNGGIANAGAVTLIDKDVGTSGFITDTNSLVGGSVDDYVGYEGYIFEVGNSNFVVASSYWDDSGTADVGAITWGSGTTGVTGYISTANSLLGSSADDKIGEYWGVRVTANGNTNYLVLSPDWDNVGAVDAGAVTWGDGNVGVFGYVSAANSLVGTTAGDAVGYSVDWLANGNYIVRSSSWDNGAIEDAGAVTWGNGLTGISGAVSTANSLYGTQDFDQVGSNYGIVLSNGNYVIHSLFWDNGGIADAGAVTWIDGTTGLVGALSSANSLVGTSTDDFASIDLGELDGDYYYVMSGSYNDGANVDAGFFTLLDTTVGTSGNITIANAIIGSSANDNLGSGSIEYLNDYLAFDVTGYDDGANVDAGAIVFVGFLGGTSGYLNSSNAYFGSVAGAELAISASSIFDNTLTATSLNTQTVKSITASGSLGNYDSYGDYATGTITLDPGFITATLDGGTDVTLQASNDITINNDIIANNAGGDGGDLTLQAGRSILINADIFSDNGNVYLLGNQKLATGVVNAQRDSGNAVITMVGGTSIDAGTGDIIIRLDDGAGLTNDEAGNITLTELIAETILVENVNATGDVILDVGSVLSASGAGDAITIASGRNFINNGNASSLSTPSGRWLVYSRHDSYDSLNGLAADFTQYTCSYGSCAVGGMGNGLLYSLSQSLTPTPTPTPEVPATVMPPTVLFVSQAPVPQIINHNDNAQIIESSETVVEETANRKKSKREEVASLDNADSDIAETIAKLFNGWISIAPELVRKLNLQSEKI